MQFLIDLWMPIALSAVLVFVASSVIHMALPIHKSDFKKIAEEAGVLEALRSKGVQPGEYMFPCPDSMKDMGSPEMMEKYEAGPVGWLSVLPPGPPTIGKSLVQWFLYSIAISVFCAYLASFALAQDAAYLDVFRLTGTAAFLGYGVGNVTNSIWKAVSWGTTLKYLFDGLVYALVTAGSFAWLWA